MDEKFSEKFGCIMNYLKDQNTLVKKFVDVLLSPQEKISVLKMNALLYYFEDYSEDFEWLHNNRIENYLIWTLCEFVKLTLVFLGNVFDEER